MRCLNLTIDLPTTAYQIRDKNRIDDTLEAFAALLSLFTNWLMCVPHQISIWGVGTCNVIAAIARIMVISLKAAAIAGVVTIAIELLNVIFSRGIAV